MEERERRGRRGNVGREKGSRRRKGNEDGGGGALQVMSKSWGAVQVMSRGDEERCIG